MRDRDRDVRMVRWQINRATIPRALCLWGGIQQAMILLGLDQLYELGRGIVPQHASVALAHGLKVVRIEKRLHLFDEWHLQRFVLGHHHRFIGPLALRTHAVVSVINHVYLYGHVIGTLTFLAWLYLFRRRYFALVRDIFVVTTGAAFLVYIVFPMMPPRLMSADLRLPQGYRIQDTLAPFLATTLHHAQLGYNPYAAMPSLHFAWALIVGATLVLIGRHVTLRAIGAVYPPTMLATIVVSGNHLFLDAAGSLVVVALAALVVGAIHRHGPWWPETRPAVLA